MSELNIALVDKTGKLLGEVIIKLIYILKDRYYNIYFIILNINIYIIVYKLLLHFLYYNISVTEFDETIFHRAIKGIFPV